MTLRRPEIPLPPLIRLDEIDSTNIEARRRIAAGANDPFFILAALQTGGIGRLARRWDSPRGGLWLTLAWPRSTHDPRLGLRAALVVARAIQDLGRLVGVELDVRLKWPNDILIGGAKVAGVLVELLSHRRTNWALIGVGINASNTLESLDPALHRTATTLRDHVPAPVDRQGLERLVARSLAALCSDPPPWPADLADARGLLHAVARPVTVTLADASTHSGILAGLSDDGALILDRPGGPWTVPLGAELTRVD